MTTDAQLLSMLRNQVAGIVLVSIILFIGLSALAAPREILLPEGSR
jgi:hypothetical protein